MGNIRTNKDIYQGEEFSRWSHREGLIQEEEYLINHYCEKHLRTLEAGTAGGRILLEMNRNGFTDLHGYDFVPELIDVAIRRDTSNQIEFAVDDAISLHYDDASFDQILYLAQIISFIESPDDRLKAIKEAYRVLRPGGTALFSFLLYETRNSNLLLVPLMIYLRLLRKVRGSQRPLRALPWLRLNGKPNLHALLDKAPYNYWFRLKEAKDLLESNGFQVIALGTSHQLRNDTICDSYEELTRLPLRGMLYIACRKPISVSGSDNF